MAKDKDIKCFNVRLPFEDWKFLKYKAANKRTSLNALLIEYIAKDKKKLRKNLTSSGTMVL